MTRRRRSHNPLKNAVLEYANESFHVFPLAQRTKVPLAGSGSFTEGTDDVNQLTQWWSDHPAANIGIATGSVSGIVVIDIDMKNGMDGENSWTELCDGRTVPETLSVRTPNNGRHLYFAAPQDTAVSCKVGLRAGIDVRGMGGYIVAPPSATSDGVYEIIDRSRSVMHMPQWLIDLLTEDHRPPEPPLAGGRSDDLLSGVEAGRRNHELFRYTASLHARGLSSAEKRRLVVEAAANCSPPLPKQEVKQILKSVKRYGTNFELTERGNALRMRELHGEALKFSTDGYWYAYNKDSGIWQKDDWAAKRYYDEAIELIAVEARNQKDDERKSQLEKHYRASQQSRFRRGTLEMATTVFQPRLDTSRLDADPFMLKLTNGVVDLRSGDLTQSTPEMLISKCTGVTYDENSSCPRFEQFLDGVTQGDAELQEFIQRAVGYTLTADASEQVMFVLYGDGENGKTTLVDVISMLLGDYSIAGPPQMLARKPRSQTNDLARLRGIRMLTTAEEAAGSRMDEVMVKQLTGGDAIAARRLYQEFSDIECRAKMWMTTNYHLQIEGVDHAIWRRIRVIPFNACFKGRRDNGLREALRAELPGILNWALEGCRNWLESGLGSCAAVDVAGNEYRNSSDVLYDWLQSRTRDDPAAVTPVADLKEGFLDHCGLSAADMTDKRFSALLKQRGYKSIRKGHGVCYQGIALGRRRRRKRGKIKVVLED